MTAIQVFAIALKAMLLNKTRSLLTVLGIIIGVASVIAMVSVGEGAKQRVMETFSTMGTNLLIVLSGTSRSGGLFGGYGSRPTLTWDDLRAIRQEVPAVRRAAPQSQGRMQVVAEDQNWSTMVYGVQPDYFGIRNWQTGSGTFFDDADLASAAKVAVVGTTVADKLFGRHTGLIGRTMRIKNVPFRIVGVPARKGQSPTGQDSDDAVFVPITSFGTTLQGSLPNFIAGAIFVEATSPGTTQTAQRQIAAMLRDRHRLRAEDEDDFNIRNLQEVVDAQLASTNTLTTLLAALAAVSLLVGGIGIMNIMLVSVTERTREIGLRMAIGATPHSVLAQFLVEAVTLSLTGGLIGVGVGVGTAVLLSKRFGWVFLLRADIVGLSLLFSALVGVFFGVYPARKASRLDPVEALHHE
jgi:putative ABC transport system permease protein